MTPEERRRRQNLESAQRSRARQRGEDVPLLKPGMKPGTERLASDKLKYQGQHARVRRVRGKSVECVFGCVPDRPYKRFYTWANMTGDRGNPWDYAPMCYRCHKRFDGAVRSVEFPGAPLGNARLTADDVREIRALAANGVTRRETARQFSISKSNVTMIVNRHTWRHIQ